MCKFKSAIVLRDATVKAGFRLIHSPATDSHSELIRAHNLHDGGRLTFARVEFTAPKGKEANPESYVLSLDEGRTPEWWTDEMAEGVAVAMRRIVAGMIAKDGQHLLGGAWIVPVGATVTVGPMTLVAYNFGFVSYNHGTVRCNVGFVSYNHGTVSHNYGTVGYNYGTVGEKKE